MLKVKSDNTTMIFPKDTIFKLKKWNYSKKYGAVIAISILTLKKEYKDVTIYFNGIINDHKLFFRKKVLVINKANTIFGG